MDSVLYCDMMVKNLVQSAEPLIVSNGWLFLYDNHQRHTVIKKERERVIKGKEIYGFRVVKSVAWFNCHRKFEEWF